MKFREGTVGDKNNGYIYSDFTLTGQTGGQVEVYVKSYKVEVTNKYTKRQKFMTVQHILLLTATKAIDISGISESLPNKDCIHQKQC